MSSSKRNPEKQAKNEYIPYFIAKKPFYIDDDTEGDYRTSPPPFPFPFHFPSP